MNKYLSLLVVCALVFSGCTKSKSSKTSKKKKDATKTALNDQNLFNYDGLDGTSEDEMLASSKSVQNEIDELISLWEEEVPGEGSTLAMDFDPVTFEINKSNIDGQELELQKDIEQALALVDEGKDLVVKGHCCQTGPQSWNMSLSQNRADIVRSKLIKAGIPAAKIKAVGCGSANPVVSSNASDRKQLVKELKPNRRSEISVL